MAFYFYIMTKEEDFELDWMIGFDGLSEKDNNRRNELFEKRKIQEKIRKEIKDEWDKMVVQNNPTFKRKKK